MSASRGATARRGSRATARTSAAPTSTCSCAAACTTCSSPACTSTTSRGTFSTSAFTPFNGSGGNLLTATFPLTGITAIPPTGWNGFTLGYDRRDWGGYAEWQKNSPWYFRVDGNEVKFSGTRPGSASNGTSPGNGYTDLAFPQDFKTTNWGVEGGYQSSKATFAVRWDYSKFENSNETLRWTNPFFGPTVGGVATTSNLLDTTYLAPANTFNKFTLSGNYRDLPWQSVISARYTYAKTTSDTPIAPHGAQHQRRLQQHAAGHAQLQRRARQPVVPAGVDRDAGRELEHARLLLLDEAREQLGLWSSSATRRRSRSPPAWAAETSSWPVFRRRRSATAIPSSTTTRRTTSASTPGGGLRGARGWASATTTSTSTRRASTTTSRTRTSCGSSTRTRCSTRCRDG